MKKNLVISFNFFSLIFLVVMTKKEFLVKYKSQINFSLKKYNEFFYFKEYSRCFHHSKNYFSFGS